MWDNVFGAIIMTEVISRVHSVHMMNVGQRQAAADPPTMPTNLGCESTCVDWLILSTSMHHRHSLLLGPKADILILPSQSHGGVDVRNLQYFLMVELSVRRPMS